MFIIQQEKADSLCLTETNLNYTTDFYQLPNPPETFTPGLQYLKDLTISRAEIQRITSLKRHKTKKPIEPRLYSFRDVSVNVDNSLEKFTVKAFNNDTITKIFKNVDCEWSFIVWRDNWFLDKNFRTCDGVIIDIDGGKPSLNEAIEAMQKADLLGWIYTTKSHQLEKHGLTCDRYRIVLPLDIQIEDICHYKRVMWAVINILFDKDKKGFSIADEGILKGTWKCRGGGQDSQIFTFDGSNILSANKISCFAGDNIKSYFAERNNFYEWYEDKQAEWSKDKTYSAIPDGIADGNVKNALQKYYDKYCDLPDTYCNIFKLMIYAYKLRLSDSLIKATILSMPVVSDYYGRHPQQNQYIDQQLQNAKESHLEWSLSQIIQSQTELKPLNPVSILSAS